MAFLNEIDHVGIYGVGLLGGSLGMALKARFPHLRVSGIGRSAERLQNALDRGAIDDFVCDPASLSSTLDLLVVCTPVRLVPIHVAMSLPSLKPGALVTDVGSTKVHVVQQCEAAMGNRGCFVGSHPMAGSHKTSVDAARPDLFQNRVCIVTRTENTHPAAFERILDFWASLGMLTRILSPARHDFLTARTSHLPHLVAAALCGVVMHLGPEGQGVLGDGFYDTTRIAAGDPALWLDIAFENREEIIQSLRECQQNLQALQTWLEQGDEGKLAEFLEKARSWKNSL